MEVLLVAGAGLAVAAAVNAANKNNPDRKLAQQEKAAHEALRKAQSKRHPNPAEIAQLEQQARAITIERMHQTMLRSEQKMVKYRQEGQIAKADKHSQRAASLRAELNRIAPHILNQQYQQQPYPQGAVMAAIPLANSVPSPQPSVGHKGTFAQWPPSNSSNNQPSAAGQGPYTLGDYMGASSAHQQPSNQSNYYANQSHAQQQYNQQPQPMNHYQAPQNVASQPHRGATLPEAREVLRTPAVSPLPQFQGSQSQSAQSAFSGTSYQAGNATSSSSNNQSNTQSNHHYSSNNFPVESSASSNRLAQSNSQLGQRAGASLPEAREVVRTPDVTPLAQFQQTRPPVNVTSAPGGPVVHIDLSHGDAPPPYAPSLNDQNSHSNGQQAYQNNPPPSYAPADWTPSKK